MNKETADKVHWFAFGMVTLLFILNLAYYVHPEKSFELTKVDLIFPGVCVLANIILNVWKARLRNKETQDRIQEIIKGE